MKKIIVTLLLLTSSFFVASAQQATKINPTVLATVNIYNATSTQQGNKFSVSFDLTNRIGIQPGVKYSILLMEEDKTRQSIVDEHVYDDITNLGEHSSVHKTVNYTAPSNLSGDFTLLVSSKNTNGFPFGVAIVGKVHLLKSGIQTSGVSVDAKSCYLTIEGEENSPHYTSLQAVDIAPTENLQSNCILENTSNITFTVVPSFSTRIRSSFGDIVTTPTGAVPAAVVLSPHEKKMVTTIIPRALSPQLYHVTVAYGSGSNSVSYSYMIRGVNGTVQNIIVDKDMYAQGDIANISFMWSVSTSTGGLRTARNDTSTPLMSPAFTIILTNEEGKVCASPFTQTLTTKDIRVPAKIAITSACSHPKVDVTLSDAKLGVLSHVIFNTATTTPPLSEKGNTIPEVVGVGALLMVLMALLVSIIFRKRLLGHVPAPLLILMAISMAMGVEKVKADTFYSSIPDAYATVSTNKSSYTPGEQITINGSVTNTAGAESTNWVKLQYNISSSPLPSYTNNPTPMTTMIDAGGQTGLNWGEVVSATAYTGAPGAVGDYFVNFYLQSQTYNWMAGYGNNSWMNYAYSFTVSAPAPAPAVNIHFSLLNTVKKHIYQTASDIMNTSLVEKAFASK